ncbi:MAG: aminomethyltransferase family protein, partial [Pseudomonadota bacterium]
EAEARAVREGVGLFDATPFAKTRVRGPGAAAFLDRLTCNKLPKVGRINLTYALTVAGTVRTEATIVRLAEDDFYVVTAGAAQAYDLDFFEKEAARHRDALGWIEVQDVTSQWGVLAIAGPKSRDVLRELIVDADPATALGAKRFPWLSMRTIDLGMVPVRAIRVAYTGELGWELHHPMEMQAHLLDGLLKAGEGHGLRMFGARAQNWLRQEKSYRAFGSDLGRDASPLESGLDRFVDLSKEFRGKAAMEALGIRAKCVTVKIHGPDDADPWGRESLLSGGDCVGRLTSGGWSVALGTQIGLGYVPPALSTPGTKLQCRIMDALWDAEVVEDSPYDPSNARIRADG